MFHQEKEDPTSTSDTEENLLSHIPDELREMIWDYLPTPSTLNMQRVSSFFRQTHKDYFERRLMDFFKLKQKSYFIFPEDSLYLFHTGLVAALGNNSNGKLGLGSVSKVDQPMFIKSLSKTTIIKVSLGGDHSAMLDDAGQVWVCGDNKSGQLGLGNKVNEVNTPTKLSNLPFITDILCLLNFTLLRDSQNCIYFCGSNYMDQSNLGKNNKIIFEPTVIKNRAFPPIIMLMDTNQIETPSIKENDTLMKSFLQKRDQSHTNKRKRV